MTTAPLWWLAVLALTGGLAVTVRAWPWSADQADPSELRTRHLGARLALLPVVLLLALVVLATPSFLGWSSTEPGWARLREASPILGICALAGVGVAAGLRTMTGRPATSWWLLAGALPALAGAAAALGA